MVLGMPTYRPTDRPTTPDAGTARVHPCEPITPLEQAPPAPPVLRIVR